MAFKQQLEGKEKSIDQRLQIYLKKGWTDTYTATSYAYSESFDKLNINAIREYLEDPVEYMTNLFNADYTIYSETLVESILREIDEYFMNTKENLLNAISEWSALFEPDRKYDELPLSTLFLYLIGRSISYEYSSLRIFLQRKYNINMKETVPEHDLSEIFKDINSLLGSIIIEKPVDFCKLFCRSLIEGLTDMQATWINTEKNITRVRMQAQLATKYILKSHWNQLGCSARCPLCSSKCELPEDDHTQHQATKHFLPAFVGFRNRNTGHPSLIICTEDDAYDKHKWAHSNDSNYLPLNEFLRKHHPSWLPFPRSEPSDEHITKMRAVWWKLKDELCKKFDMIDNTDPSWGARYGSLIP
ncbi:hypothetical protein C1645_772646 [Glomus cerebriforme]|uniref:Uncharacterized protein n=1 Tax=Glomus cerebriforme TaxID=658196 RepID=A0A397ST63_9GLOM|nr:hypothetical protein C1645_772646 [Glomus cerebriforme]